MDDIKIAVIGLGYVGLPLARLFSTKFTTYNPQIEMFARFKMKSSFHKTKRII